MSKVEELLEQVRELPKELQLVFYDTLHGMIFRRDPEWELAWSEEVRRRIASVESGEVQLDDPDVVMRRLRERLFP